MKILPAVGAVSESLQSLKVCAFIILNVCTMLYVKNIQWMPSKNVKTNTIVETNINIFNQLCFI